MAETLRSTLQRLQAEDAVGQLRRRDGQMAKFGSENGDLKLDWVEGVARLLEHPEHLEQVESDAAGIWQRGIRHIIWAGMGGSVLTVRVMAQLHFCDGDNGERIAIYPLDSTDPAALNAIIERIAAAKQITVRPGENDPAQLRQLLTDVMMIGVAMGMTSEEPITHLAWFTEMLEQAGLVPAEHLLVMTLPNSYLDQFARARNAPSLPLQLDGGNGTGGRMSAPATRVFLMPAALFLTRSGGKLHSVLSQAWQHYNLDLAASDPVSHPFTRLAAALSTASQEGVCRMLVEFPPAWQALVSWIEQLMEESLGKGNRGIVVFKESAQYPQAHVFQVPGALHVLVSADEQPGRSSVFTLSQPYLGSQEPRERLAALAASFLGWQLTMALYGYLQGITFAGQPAVEDYKARARAIRDLPDPLQAAQGWPGTFSAAGLTLFAPAGSAESGATTPANVFGAALRRAGRIGYLDLTINGEVPADLEESITNHLYTIGNRLLGAAIKPRHAPADYHSTEQGEMDGSPDLVSLRLLVREHQAPLVGKYTDAFLRAQAVSTWQAMIGQGRACFLLVADGNVAQAREALQRFFAEVEQALASEVE